MNTELIVKVVKTAFITIVLSRIMIVGGRKEFSQLIKIGGLAIIGIHCAEALANWKAEHSRAVKVFSALFDFIAWLTKGKGEVETEESMMKNLYKSMPESLREKFTLGN